MDVTALNLLNQYPRRQLILSIRAKTKRLELVNNDSENNAPWCLLKLAPLFLYLISCVSFASSTEQSPTFVLSTTPVTSERLRIIDGQVDQEEPGYFGELFATAGEACRVNVDYEFAPWNRVLRMVEFGKVDAAFRSSFKEERAVYGAYPRTAGGDLDLDRAMSVFSYSLFIRKGVDLSWDGVTAEGKDRRVAVETDSRGISIAESLNLRPKEARDLTKLAELAAAGRVDAVLANTENFANQIGAMGINELIKLATPPVEAPSSYLMFSKITYEKYPDQVECFWNEMAAIMKTPEYQARVKFYQSAKKD